MDEEKKENAVDEEDRIEEMNKQMAALLSSVKDASLSQMSLLASQAWHHLGLVPLPGSGDPKMDLEQSRLAIDLFDANLKVLAPHIDKEIEKEFKRTLADLQLNFVNKSGKGE